MGKVADIERKIVRERPEVQLVDWSVLSAPDGSYSATMADRSGNEITVRADDGVHFSPGRPGPAGPDHRRAGAGQLDRRRRSSAATRRLRQLSAQA